MLLGTDAKVNNLLGTFGAFISHFFIYKGFGIASYFICSFFFVVGINLFFDKKVFSVRRNIKYVITGLIILSVSAAVIMNGKVFPWGGAVGNMTKDWMYKTIGQIGTLAVLAVAILVYVIWRFNPVFKLPSKKIYNSDNELKDIAQGEMITAERDTHDLIEPLIKVDDNKGNTLKGEKGGMLNIPLHVNAALNHDLQIIEKEIPGTIDLERLKSVAVDNLKREHIVIEQVEESIPEYVSKEAFKNNAGPALELEIKTVQIGRAHV